MLVASPKKEAMRTPTLVEISGIYMRARQGVASSQDVLDLYAAFIALSATFTQLRLSTRDAQETRQQFGEITNALKESVRDCMRLQQEKRLLATQAAEFLKEVVALRQEAAKPRYLPTVCRGCMVKDSLPKEIYCQGCRTRVINELQSAGYFAPSTYWRARSPSGHGPRHCSEGSGSWDNAVKAIEDGVND